MRSFADCHLHIYNYDYKETESLLDEISGKGVTDAALQSLSAHPTFGIAQNDYCLYVKNKYKKIRLYAFCSLEELLPYSVISYDKQLEKLFALGADGIKFIQMKPNVRRLLGKGINDPSYDLAFSMFEERGTPILIHSGDPETFWDISKMSEDHISRGWFYGAGNYLSSQEHYRETFERLDKNPKLNAVLAHFFFLSFKKEEAERVLDRYPNVSFDLTPGWEMYDGFSLDVDYWHDFFEKYSSRIIFGTDDHDCRKATRGVKDVHKSVYEILTHNSEEFITFFEKRVRGLYLSSQALDNICYNNFKRYVGGDAALVNETLLWEDCERTYKDIKDIAGEEKGAAWLKSIL